jgi:hypothetical protein
MFGKIFLRIYKSCALRYPPRRTGAFGFLSAGVDTHSSPILATPNSFYAAYRFFCFGGQYGGHFSKQKAKKTASTSHLSYTRVARK